MTDPYMSLSDIIPEISVYNICGRFSMNIDSIDLLYLSSKIWNTSYNPRRLPAIVMRKTKPRATILIFRTGRALVVGAESMQQLEEVSRKVAKEIGATLNIKKLKVQDLAVTNILAVGSLGFKIDLGRLCEHHRATKPDNTPGVIYRLDEPFKKVMVHRNGKIIFLGAKSLDDIDTAFEIMKQEMRLYEHVTKGDRSDCSDHELTTV